VLLELLHGANVSHAHVETVKILPSDATGYSPEVRSAQGFPAIPPTGLTTQTTRGVNPRH
jgi:hypothetical protein